MKTLEIGQTVKIQSGSEILTGKVVPAWRNENACFGVQYDNGGYRKFSRKTGKAYAAHNCTDKVIFE